MSSISVQVSPTQHRSRQAYESLLTYETEQLKQETARKVLGAPYGRGPPPKLPRMPHSRSPSTLATCASSFLQPVSRHRPTGSDVSIHLVDSTLAEPFRISLAVEDLTLSRKSSVGRIRATTRPQSPLSIQLNPFERPQGKCYFFPLEMFMEWTSLPALPTSGLYRQGRVWRECIVISHDTSSRLFEILLEAGESRQVARKRLRFCSESQEQFEEAIEKAETLRKSHEGFVRYFIRSELSLTQSKSPISKQFLDNQKAVFEKIGLQLSRDSASTVKEELWDLHRRSVHKFTFDVQYFPPTADLIAQPWKPHLSKQERWKQQTANLHHFPYQAAKERIQQSLMDPRKQLHLARLMFYRGLTRLRCMDFYSCLREFQGTKSSFVQLKGDFRNKFAKAALVVDSAVKQLSDNVFKVLEGNTAISLEAEALFADAEVVLESNLQFAVANSARTLRDIFNEYYRILPIAGDLSMKFKQLPDLFLLKHSGSVTSPATKVTELQSISITKEMISVLHSDLSSNRLSQQHYLSPSSALISITIESHWSREGKRHDHFALSDIKWEIGVRRATASKLRSSSKLELSETIKVNKAIRNLLLLTDECALNETGEGAAPHTLLSEAAFGWVSAGKDKMNIDLSPNIGEIDLLLQKLLKAPLKNLIRIKKFTLRTSEKQRIRVRNAASEIKAALADIAEVLQFSLYGPIALLGLLREFDYLYSKRFADLFMQLVKAHIEDYSGLVAEIRTVLKHRDVIARLLPDSLQFGIFEVQLRLLKFEGTRNAAVLVDALFRELINEHLAIMTEITKEFTELLARLSYTPQTVEELDELQAFLESRKDETVMLQVNRELDKVAAIETSLEDFHTSLPDEQVLMSRKTVAWEAQLAKEKHRLSRRVQRLIPAFQEAVQKQVGTLKAEVLVMKADMADFVTYSELQNADVYASKASDVLDRFQKLKSDVETVKNRERILKLPGSDFSELATMESQFLSYHVFWNYASEWSSAYMNWMEKPLYLIDPATVQTRFNKGLKLLDKLKAELTTNVNVMKAVQEQEEMLHSFEATIPLIICLRQESLRDRHWRKIWALLTRSMGEKSESERRNTQTLRELLIKGLSKRIRDVEVICSEARSEYEIELIWTKIEKDLKSPNIVTIAHSKLKDLTVIHRLTEWKERLHESLTTINYLSKANRHIDPFRDSLKTLEQLLSAEEAIVADLHEFQDLLCELFPVFKLVEISELLPRSSARMAELLDYYNVQLTFMEAVSAT